MYRNFRKGKLNKVEHRYNDKIYRLNLNDNATPSFCGFDKPFWGTLAEIKTFIDAFENDRDEIGRKAEIVTALESRSTEKGITYDVHDKQTCFSLSHQIHSAKHTFKQYQWEHINIWDCVYCMQCSKVDTEHQWLKSEGVYYRCITTRFEDLEMKSFDGKWHRVTDNTWGIPHILCFEGNSVYNRLAIFEKIFKTKQEMEQDYQSFLKKPDPVFAEFCNEIFGDG